MGKWLNSTALQSSLNSCNLLFFNPTNTAVNRIFLSPPKVHLWGKNKTCNKLLLSVLHIYLLYSERVQYPIFSRKYKNTEVSIIQNINDL